MAIPLGTKSAYSIHGKGALRPNPDKRDTCVSENETIFCRECAENSFYLANVAEQCRYHEGKKSQL